MDTIKSPNPDRYPIDGKRLLNGRKIAQNVRNWMESHEEAWWAIFDFIKDLQSRNVAGRIRDRVAVWCVKRKINVGDQDFTFDNTLWAGISRYLVLYDPSLFNDPIRFRRSDVDCFGVYPISYLELGEE